MEKFKELKISSEKLRDLVYENYLVIDDVELDIKEVDSSYDGSGRHTEYHSKVFYIKDTDQYFQVSYEESVKDEMGWFECNYGEAELTEVEPYTETITKYKIKK